MYQIPMPAKNRASASVDICNLQPSAFVAVSVNDNHVRYFAR